MEKVIWVIGNNRNEIIEIQRKINSTGSMRGFCMLSVAALKSTVEQLDSTKSPSLIILDYQMDEAEDFFVSAYLNQQQSLAGVPLFFITEKREDKLVEDCYARGAIVVLEKPFSRSGVLRVERMAWQHEVTKNYEKMLQKQAGDLQAAREIMTLNKKLKARNDLLYQVFGRYFSDKVVEVILEKPEEASIGGERREVTIMISDLRGFTSLSEELESDEITSVLNFYFERMSEVISSCLGTIIEFLGDSVLAVFGAPRSSLNHAADALTAAIRMQNGMREVNQYCKENGYPTLEMGIGVHTGEVFIGNVGSEKMMRYNVIGRVVNECSRIESCSVGGQILISKRTLEQIKEPVQTRNAMEIVAKGVHEPILAYEAVAIDSIYNSYLDVSKSDELLPVCSEVWLELYLLEDKRIKGEPVKVLVKEISSESVVVFAEKNEFDLYSDVEIGYGKEDKAVFLRGIYAKIVKVEDNFVTLHFTHVNQTFQSFLNEVNESL